MTEEAAENSLINNTAKYTFDPERPWLWVSYDDPAWPFEPWDLMDDEDLADAAARFAIWYLKGSTESMTILKAAALVEDAAKRVAADVVAEARTQKYSWGRIAAAFGVGRTAAQKRFGKGPKPDRALVLEDQYIRMGHFLQNAKMNPGMYEYEEEARETRSRCIRRRRGHVISPLDSFRKVMAPKRRVDEGGQQP
ncbi:hypothetical protein [Streptomyces albidochromogenes]|uniref:Uncharacterized protein n=1 Tax=Streptomyces albidochromogenes TaxID=329524 RepID=A0ABW6FER5_9ACTN